MQVTKTETAGRTRVPVLILSNINSNFVISVHGKFNLSKCDLHTSDKQVKFSEKKGQLNNKPSRRQIACSCTTKHP